MSLENFDLNTASVRNSSQHKKEYLEALATKLKLSLPSQVSIDRYFRPFSKRKPIRSIIVSLKSHDFIVNQDRNNQIECAIAKSSGGIRLKTETVDFKTWLTQLNDAIKTLSNHSQSDDNILSEFLE